ncbi:MAG TPA: hypothetical protein PLD59_01905, partial [Tepidisphaeraceae bacterium]|nr:hypothetical protein [Tepidisphaeraceae bacterium]
MQKWLEKNKKRLLAVIGVFLMVAFLAPSTFQGCHHGQGSFGTMATGNVDAVNVQNAVAEFEYAAQNIGVLQTDPTGAQQFVSILQATPLALAADQFQEHKVLYYLVREEARQLGAGISDEQLDEVLGQINIRMPDGSVVLYENIKKKPQGRFTRQALANLFSISAAFNRARSDIKITEPQRRADLAMQAQSISLNMVDFPADSYANKIPAPTDDQLRALFDKHKDTVAGQPDGDQNPFSFGYRFPDRVTLQYVSIDPDQVRQAVMDNPQNGATPEDRAYYWEVEARKYYNLNKSLFPSSQPASTQPSTQPVATEPEPFEVVKQRAIDAVMKPQVDRLARLVQQRVVSALSTDYNAFNRTPTTAPANTAFGHPYNSFDYLKALAQDVQRQFGVLPTVVNLADRPRSALELSKLDGIRDATAMVQGRALPFAAYAVAYAQPLHQDSSEREQAFLLSLYQPSQTLTDFGGSIYVFRLTSTDASHQPATFEEVREQLLADFKQQAAYDLALADAKQLLTTAADGKLSAVAGDRTVIETAPLRFSRTEEFTGLPLSPAGFQSLMRQAFDLMSGDTNHPKRVIELPREGRALAVELTELKGDFPEDLLPMVEAQVANQVSARLSQNMATSWFNYYNVAQRLNYIEPGAKAPATQPA